MLRCLVLALCLVIWLIAPSASAQQKIEPSEADMLRLYKTVFTYLSPEDQTFLTSKDYLQQVAKTLQEKEPKFLLKSCPTVKPIERLGISLVAPNGRTTLPDPTMNLKQTRLQMWTEYWSVDRCGTRARRSFMAGRQPTGEVKIATLVPGTSGSDPLVQRDTVRIAVGTFLNAVPGCTDKKSFEILDARITSWTAPQTRTEEWTVALCDRTAIVPINYLPGNSHNPNGTTIIVSPARLQ